MQLTQLSSVSQIDLDQRAIALRVARRANKLNLDPGVGTAAIHVQSRRVSGAGDHNLQPAISIQIARNHAEVGVEGVETCEGAHVGEETILASLPEEVAEFIPANL